LFRKHGGRAQVRSINLPSFPLDTEDLRENIDRLKNTSRDNLAIIKEDEIITRNVVGISHYNSNFTFISSSDRLLMLFSECAAFKTMNLADDNSTEANFEIILVMSLPRHTRDKNIGSGRAAEKVGKAVSVIMNPFLGIGFVLSGKIERQIVQGGSHATRLITNNIFYLFLVGTRVVQLQTNVKSVEHEDARL
jgi:hypothetical protein